MHRENVITWQGKRQFSERVRTTAAEWQPGTKHSQTPSSNIMTLPSPLTPPLNRREAVKHQKIVYSLAGPEHTGARMLINRA